MHIAYLADHKEVIPVLARWFCDEWSYLHPGRTLDHVVHVLEERVHKDEIPLALVAFEGDELLGTVSLKVHDMDSRFDLTPWLAGLYVSAPRRRQGIGAALVAAAEDTARSLGVEKLHLYTPQAEHFYERLGWSVLETAMYHGYPVAILQKAL